MHRDVLRLFAGKGISCQPTVLPDARRRPMANLCFPKIVDWPKRPNYGFPHSAARSNIVWPRVSRIVSPRGDRLLIRKLQRSKL